MRLDDVFAALGMVHEFRCSATPSMFSKAFGERVGAHLWDKFVALNYDAVALWSYLDGRNRQALVAMVYAHGNRDREQKHVSATLGRK